MKILGLNLGYLATASFLKDGRIHACCSEERFTRMKNEESYPKNAVEYVLDEAGVGKGREIDKVAIGSLQPDLWHRLAHYYSRFTIKDRIEEQYDYWKPTLCEGRQVSWRQLYGDRFDLSQYPGTWETLLSQISDNPTLTPEDQQKVNEFIVNTISAHIDVPGERIEFVDHHTAHAAYAYFASPFRDGETLVITIDAYGDGNSATVSIGRKDSLTRIKAIDHGNFQVARLFRYITLLLGMKPDEHEYKVMGLAPYAKPETWKAAYEVFANTMYVDNLDFAFHDRPKDFYHYFREKLEGIRFDGIAAGLQVYTEDLLRQWISNVVAHTGISRLVFAGGAAMNIKAIMEISRLPNVSQVFVPPSAGDESLGMGAAYQVFHRTQNIAPEMLKSAYLGPEVSAESVQAVLADFRSRNEYVITENVTAGQIAERLAAGRVIGRCAGRMEFGARSLGNRSIIADPRSAKMIRKINEKIKNRDFWMPFAPAILASSADRYIKNPKRFSAPFMTIAFDTMPVAQEDLAAAIHPSDFTARPQIVDAEVAPEFAEIITEFERLTGVGGVLNTSFNLHGEPIVRTAADASRVFTLTDIDDLVVGTAMVSKKRPDEFPENSTERG